MPESAGEPPGAGGLEAAEISYHAAVSVQMDFGLLASTASQSPFPYYTFFRYDPDGRSSTRFDSYIVDDIQWLRVVQLRGQSEVGGHSWIVAGYNKNTTPWQYLMNMGWGGGTTDWYTCDDVFPEEQHIVTRIAPEDVVRFVAPAVFGGGGDGTPSDPYLGLAYALQQAPDDTTLILKAGTTQTLTGTSAVLDRPMTFKGHDRAPTSCARRRRAGYGRTAGTPATLAGRIAARRHTSGSDVPSSAPALFIMVPPAAPLRVVFVECLQPAAAGVVAPVKAADVRLDVQQRRAVEDVDVLDMQRAALETDQAHEAQADGVRAPGTARGEHAVLGVLKEGLDGQPRLPGTVEEVDQPQVRETLEVGQSLGKGRVDLDRAGDSRGEDRLDRGLLGGGVGAVDDADRMQCDFVHARSMQSGLIDASRR